MGGCGLTLKMKEMRKLKKESKSRIRTAVKSIELLV